MTIDFKRRPGKSIKSRRALKKYEPKIFENVKKVLFLKGQKTNEEINEVATDLAMTLSPHTKKLAKRNAFHPFEGRSHLEFLGFKNDCSLFAFTSHSKKREHNVVLGRMHDFHVLDMFEFGVVGKDRLDLSEMRKMGVDSASIGGKPCFVFQGAEFATDPFFIRLKNFFVDFFRCMTASAHEIVLTGIDRAIFVSLRSTDGGAVAAPESRATGASKSDNNGNAIVCFRQYAIARPSATSKSAQAIELTDIGPNLDLAVRRSNTADDQTFKHACYMPKQALAQLRSMHAGVSEDGVGNLRGQLHVGAQDVAKGLALRKFKAHKRGRGEASAAAAAGGDASSPAGDDNDDGAVDFSFVAEEGRRPKKGAAAAAAAAAAASSSSGAAASETAAKVQQKRKVQKVRRVDPSGGDGEEGAASKRRHKKGQGREATKEAISNVDM